MALEVQGSQENKTVKTLKTVGTTAGPWGGASGVEPTCQCRRQKRCGFDPWSGKIVWRRKWQPTPVFLPGKFHGQRSLAGYRPWGRTESDRAEQQGWGTQARTRWDTPLQGRTLAAASGPATRAGPFSTSLSHRTHSSASLRQNCLIRKNLGNKLLHRVPVRMKRVHVCHTIGAWQTVLPFSHSFSFLLRS